MGTFTLANMETALRASMSATSCGVVTMIDAIDADGLHDGELDVAGAGREIEHEVVEIFPSDLAEKLLGVAGGHRPADDDGRAVF